LGRFGTIESVARCISIIIGTIMWSDNTTGVRDTSTISAKSGVWTNFVLEGTTGRVSGLGWIAG